MPTVAEANAVIGIMFGTSPNPTVMATVDGYALVLLLLLLHALEARWIANQQRWSEHVARVWRALPGPVQALAAFPLLVVVVGITKVVRGAFIYFQF